MVFLCKRVIATFRVNFQGCKLLMHGDASTQRILQVCNCWLSMWGCSTCSPLSDFSFPRNTGFMRLFLGDMEGNLSSPLFRPCFWGVTLKNYDCKRSREATHLKVSMLCKWTVEKCKLNLVWKKHVFPQEIANTWFQLITSKFVHPSYPAAFSCNWYLPKKQTKLAVTKFLLDFPKSEKIIDPILESNPSDDPRFSTNKSAPVPETTNSPPKNGGETKAFPMLFLGGALKVYVSTAT